MIHKKHGLMIMIDAQPSEQINYHGDLIGCICGVFCHPSGVKGLKQYKDTAAGDRPNVALGLAKKLDSKNIVDAIAIIARYKSIERYGKEFLKDLPEKVAKKNGKRYKIQGKKVNQKLALLLPWYAVALCMIGLRAAIWAKRIGARKVTLVTDKLPGSEIIGMEFLRRISHHPEIFPMWRKTEEEYKVKFHITNMGSFRSKDGTDQHPDDHPAMIMADWLVHSVFAASNHRKDLDGGVGRSEEYRRSLTEPWFKLYEKEKMILMPIDNIVMG